MIDARRSRSVAETRRGAAGDPARTMSISLRLATLSSPRQLGQRRVEHLGGEPPGADWGRVRRFHFGRQPNHLPVEANRSRKSVRSPALAITQLPRQDPAGFKRLPAPGLRNPGLSLDRGRVLGQRNEPIAVQQPQEPSLIDARERPVAIATEQVVSSPAKGRGYGAERAIEEMAHVIDKLLPTPRRHVGGWAIGAELGETLSPYARDACIVLDD